MGFRLLEFNKQIKMLPRTKDGWPMVAQNSQSKIATGSGNL
jgi:hypothetical protein